MGLGSGEPRLGAGGKAFLSERPVLRGSLRTMHGGAVRVRSLPVSSFVALWPRSALRWDLVAGNSNSGDHALRGRGCANCQSLPQAELFVRQRERLGLHSPPAACAMLTLHLTLAFTGLPGTLQFASSLLATGATQPRVSLQIRENVCSLGRSCL